MTSNADATEGEVVVPAGGAEVLFHNARQVETDRQQLFMRKQRLGRQQSQLEPQLEETARIPAPWDREEQEETEEQQEALSSNLDHQAEGRLSPNLGRQVEEREGGVSSRSGRQERTENVDQDEQGAYSVDETARKGKTIFVHCSIVPDPSCFVTDSRRP